MKKRNANFIFKIFLFFLTFISFKAYPQQDSISVFFLKNEYNLSNESKVILDSIEKVDGINVIQFYGYCDTIGNIYDNNKLAKERIKSLHNYFSKHIKSHIAFHDFPMGESNLFVAGFSDQLSINRRVDIIIHHSKIRSTSNENFESLVSLKKGDRMKIPNLNFQAGTHHLLVRSYSTLKKLSEILKKYPKIKIELQGHVCCINEGDGPDPETGTNDLSVNRAREVCKYLIQEGIDSTRLQYRGFGSSRKIVEETTEFNREINRRVEIIILDN